MKIMKKILSLILGLVLLLSAYPVVFGAEAAAADSENESTLFTVDSDHVETTEISGDLVDGAAFTLSGSGRTRIMTTSSYPISTLSFDYGYRYSGNSFGEFGISKSGDIANVDDGCSGSDKLTFFYRISNQTLMISVRWPDKQEKQIAAFDTATYRPGDSYWAPNISNFSFVKVDGHWHLAADGNVCNNVADNFAYSCLESVLGAEFFENNENVYLYFGGYDSGTGYFKQLSATSEDGMWESRAIESYRYTYGGAVREYRGQGNTPETIHSKIPAAATGSAEDGHIVDFTGTDGYAQTVWGYDLKTTTFYISPVTYDGNTNNLWYYLGFTANPAAFQYHSAKPGDSIELYAASVYSNNYTGAWLNTNPATECYADESKGNIDLGRFGQWRTHTYNSNYTDARLCISFVQDTGADGSLHWYMQTNVSGTKIVIKSADADNDKYLQFDNMIDKPVYFRMGTRGTTSASFKMYCRIEGTQVVLPGDVNGDNRIDVKDLVVLKKYIASLKDLSAAGMKAADIDLDGDIDTDDLAQLRKIILW